MAALVGIESYRMWAGANLPASTPDQVIDDALNEAESQLAAEVGADVDAIATDSKAVAVGRGDVLRRASRLLARRNSPEGIAGAGAEGLISVSPRDPDSANCVRVIRSILLVPEGVS
jgi:hypothetical protein